MKTLSFDVGIKNLAFCLLEKEKEKEDNKTTILDWGILNICTDEVCDHVSTNGSKCDKSAKCFIVGSEFKLCSGHMKQKAYEGNKTKNIPKLKNPMLELGEKIVKTLDEKELFLDVDAIIIENQPALKNPTMKSVQMLLYSYFLIRGFSDESKAVKNIEMINARNKLKAYPKEAPIVPCEITDKYKKTKFLGIEYTRWMMENTTEVSDDFKKLFHDSKKKDDLADAYLQGMYWLMK